MTQFAITKPKTDAERQATRRQRRKEEAAAMRWALVVIAKTSDDAKSREIAMNALLKEKPD